MVIGMSSTLYIAEFGGSEIAALLKKAILAELHYVT